MLIRRFLQQSPHLVAAVRSAKRLTAPVPTPATFWDGQRRPTDLGLRRLLRLWRTTPELAAESEAAYAAYSGGDFVDVGAYHGWYAVLLSPKAAAGDTFLMMEPDPEAYPALLRTLSALARLFPHVRYVAVPIPAGDGSCVQITYPYGRDGHPRFASYDGDEAARSLPLDRAVAGLALRPTFVKIDVEGAETFVINGALDLFAGAGPAVMLETHPHWQPEGVVAEDVAAPLRAAGYASRTLSDAGVAIRELWERPRQAPADC